MLAVWPTGVGPAAGCGGRSRRQPAAAAAAGPPTTLRACASSGSNTSGNHRRRNEQGWRRGGSSSSSKTVAAAADSAPGALSDVPFMAPVAPKLRSRGMAGSPADGLWGALADAVLRLELVSAAAVDRHERWGPPLLAALAGVTTAMGADAATLLQHGLPPYLQDILLLVAGAWDCSLWRWVLAAAVLPVSAWALRCWWVASVAVLGGDGGPAQQLLQRLGLPGAEAGGGGGGGGGGGLAVAALAAARGWCLGAAVDGFTRCAAAATTAAAVQSAAAGAAAAALAAAPLALLLARPPAGAGGDGGAAARQQAPPVPVAALLLAVEAAWALAMVGVAPVANAAAAGALAWGLLALHRLLVAPRLLRHRAAEGDEVQLHVSLALAGSGTPFDSTRADGRPLLLQAQRCSAEFDEAWRRIATADVGGDRAGEQQQQQQQQQWSGACGPPLAMRELTANVRSWVSSPAGRWEALLPFAADAAVGLYVGESRSVPLLNPRGIGYWNPALSWWQPAADVAAKFGGRAPGHGDVFWYAPVGPHGAALPCRVAAVGESFVELDANYGVAGAALDLRVQLVAVRGEAAGADAGR